MAKKVDEQLWVRVLELEQALKDQEKQTKQRIDELGQQYHDHHNHLPALCFYLRCNRNVLCIPIF